jgi:Holliday junction DNA helicase RuvA
MIGYIQGKVLDTDGKKALVLTDSGVGYEVNYGYFLEKDSMAALYIHNHISENDASLWGFNSLEDKKMFEFLKTVNKVGSSKAYPLITTVGVKSVIEAITFDRPAVLTQAPGIGKKMAEQIILTLKDKVEKFTTTYLKLDVNSIDSVEAEVKNVFNEKTTKIINETIMALESLGYKDKETTKLVDKYIGQGVLSSEEILKNILREL